MNHGTWEPNDLVPIEPAPAHPPKLKPGDTVVLRSGGPLAVVESVAGDQVSVAFTDEQKTHRATLSAICFARVENRPYDDGWRRHLSWVFAK